MNTAEHERAPGGGAGGRSDQGGTGSSPTLPQRSDIPAEATPYQLLPPLSADEYAALVASIAADGIRVPIQVDEHGVILDGHHRAAIAAELGIDCPQVVVSNLDTEAAKRTVALSLNLSRRHLNREQTRQVIAASITADPDLSDREHARRCGVSPTTVGTVRKQLALSKLDTDKKMIAAARTRIEGMRDALVSLVLNGQLRDDVELERALRRLVPDVDGAAEQLAEVVSETADRVRGHVRAHDKAHHDEVLVSALDRYGIDSVAGATSILPWMTRSEFDRIKESARTRGWRSPVIVTTGDDGRRVLVDGRCRLVASMDDGVPECPVEVRDLDDPDGFSVSANLMRYDHTPDEVAAMEARLQAVLSAGGAR